MKRWLLVLLVLAYALGVWTGTLFAAETCVTLNVRPNVMLVQGDVDVQARVRRHGDHRGLAVAWDSDVGVAGSRWFDMEGDRDRVLFQWWNRHQPAGNYVFLATTFDALGHETGRATATIRSVEQEQP